MSRLLAAVLLAAAYVLTLGSLHPLDVAAAFAIAVAILYGLRRFLLPGPALEAHELAGRALHLPGFVLVVLREIVVGTWDVALIVIGVRPLARPGIVAIPVGERSPTGVAVTALAITLSPGEVLVDVDRERGLMLVHAIDASDPDGMRERYARIYERWQRPVFP